MDDDQLPTVDEIHVNHETIEEAYDLDHQGVRVYFPDKKLQSLLDDVREYDDEFFRAAKILRRLPILHIYEDGNKRTAWLTVVEYLDRHNLEPAMTGDIVERVMKCRERYDIEELATWLETGKIDEDRLR